MSTVLESQVYWRLLALAQQFPAIAQERLFDWVCALLDGPLNSASLGALTLARVQAGALPEMGALDAAGWQGLLAVLHGQLPDHLDPRPVAPGSSDDALLAAFASSDGVRINGHFGACPLFFIYRITPTETRLVDIRRFSARDADQAGSESNEQRAQLLDGCHLLFCEAIGGPAAARVIRHGIHPVKVRRDPSLSTQLADLRQMMDGPLPPWLAKALGRRSDLADRFDLEHEE